MTVKVARISQLILTNQENIEEYIKLLEIVMISKKILARAEYTFLGASALGTVIAATTGQIAYATSPLICSLFFNVVNRNKLAQQTSHNVSHQITQVENKLSESSRYLKEQIKYLESTSDTKDNSDDIRQKERQHFIQLKQQIDTLENNYIRLNNNNNSDAKNTAIAIYEEKLNTINQQVNLIQKSINRSVERPELEQKLANFYQAVAKQLNDSLTRIDNLVNHEYLEQRINISTEQITTQVYESLEKQIENFNLIIKDNRPQYQLVYDREGSRDVLLKALREAKQRIILVCPWITCYGASNEIIDLCEEFLERGGRLDIGWGHLSDTSFNEHRPMSEEDFLREVRDKKDANFWYEQILNEFKQLEKKYKSQINLKLLGTHEKFLVCDRSFSMIGSHNFLTSNCLSSERELGLRTNDKNIIEDLIDRFENAPSLDNSESLNHQKATPENPVRRIDRPILKTQSH